MTPDDTSPLHAAFGDLDADAPTRRSRRRSEFPADEPELLEQKPRRRRRWLWWTLGIIGVLILLAAALAVAGLRLADSAVVVRDNLTAAKKVVATVPQLAREQNVEGLDAAAAEIRSHTAAALTATDDPLWSFVEQVPVVGQNLAAVRKTTAAADILVEQAMPTAVQLLQSVDLDHLAVVDGRIDLEPYKAALPLIPALREAVASAQGQVSDINRADLIPQVDDAIGELLDVLDQAAPALDTAEHLLPVGLDVLGQAGQRKYLLVFQNTAEVRALGGNPASLALLTVDNGAIALPDQSDSTELAYDERVQTNLPLPAEMVNFYEWDFVPYMQNYTRTPDYPTAAMMLADIWQQSTGDVLDGVISVDPTALGYLLSAVGPVTLPDGVEMNADNAATVLLKDAYDKYGDLPSAFLDRYFAASAASVFDKVSSGAGKPEDLLTALTRGIHDHRILLWMTRENEQAMSAELGADGRFVPDNSQTAQVGVFVNDAGYSKLEYYLSQSIDVTADTCATGDGPATISTTLTLTSAVPTSGLSTYTLNGRGSRLGVSRETIILDVAYFAPPGADSITVDPAEGDFGLDRSGVEQGRSARSIAIGLEPGQTRSFTFTSTLPRAAVGAAGAPAAVDVRHTPLVGETPISIHEATCAG